MQKYIGIGAALLWGGAALAGDIEIFKAKEIQPDPPRYETTRSSPTKADPRPDRRVTDDERRTKPAEKVLWESRDTSLTLPQGVPVDLRTGDRAQSNTDLKLVGFELTSDAGQLAQVDRATWEAGPAAVAPAQWLPRVPAHRGPNLFLLRLGKDRYARILLGTTEVDWNSAKASSPGDIAQPTAFKLVNIRYWLSDPSEGKEDTRRIAADKINPRLVGTWKMTRPGGAMIADVPGANNTLITRVGGWSEGDKGTLIIKEDGTYRWETPDGQAIAGQCHRIRPASPAIGHTYWAIEGLGEDGFVTFDPDATHKTSDGLWAGNRLEPMAIGGKRMK